MSESEWVDYQACSREVRHVRLGSESCRLCAQPEPPERTLTSVGKFHWLCWQQRLDWADRYRPGRILDLTSDDFVTWATANPTQHREYLGFPPPAATFGTDDFPRPTRGSLLAPGQPPTTSSCSPTAPSSGPSSPARPAGLDPAGLLVLYLDGVQYRSSASEPALHLGAGWPTDRPWRAGVPWLWSDTATGTAVRVSGPGGHVAARALGAGVRRTGPVRRRGRTDVCARAADAGAGRAGPDRRRVTYRRSPRRIVLDGGPVYRAPATTPTGG